MLILNMILRITGFTQEKLANYLGVSRASINVWLTNDSSMTKNSKEIIAEKFNFPIQYFDIELDQDINIYKIVFTTLYDNWKKNNPNNSNEKENDKLNMINQILNEVEADIKTSTTLEEIGEVPDFQVLESLINGYNPFTGEIFEDNHILNNAKVKEILIKAKNNYKYAIPNITKEDLDDEQFELFEKLRKWRKEKYLEEGFYHAYIVFTDRELINIIMTDINKKEDLLKVKGIGYKKYDKYSDELYEIICDTNYGPIIN